MQGAELHIHVFKSIYKYIEPEFLRQRRKLLLRLSSALSDVCASCYPVSGSRTDCSGRLTSSPTAQLILPSLLCIFHSNSSILKQVSLKLRGQATED